MASRRKDSCGDAAVAGARRAFEVRYELQLAVEDARFSGLLHCAFQRLCAVPPALFSSSGPLGLGGVLVRVDLSHNSLERLPAQIGLLSRLEQLWVNDNHALLSLPDELADCSRLRTLDARGTALRALPARLGTLSKLVCVDLREVLTLECDIRTAYLGLEAAASSRRDGDCDELAGPAEEPESNAQPDAAAGSTPEDLPSPSEVASEDEEGGVGGESAVAETLTETDAAAVEVARGTLRLLVLLKRKHDTQQLQTLLEDKLREGLYRDACETPDGLVQVRELIARVFAEFPDLDEARDVIRNCERLFPEKLSQQCVPRARQRFDALKRDNERKKLAAKLELRMRAIYYDKINPHSVEGIVSGIYKLVTSLDDVQFLIKHAATIFPPNALDITPAQVFADLRALQDKLAKQRTAAVAQVVVALKAVYPSVEPELVSALADTVCALFGRLDDLKKLAADAANYFPAEYETAKNKPGAVWQAFRDQQSEK
jgi:hypothetical protein